MVEVELEYTLSIDGNVIDTHMRKLENGELPCSVFCEDMQGLRQTLCHLMKESIDERCK